MYLVRVCKGCVRGGCRGRCKGEVEKGGVWGMCMGCAGGQGDVRDSSGGRPHVVTDVRVREVCWGNV